MQNKTEHPFCGPNKKLESSGYSYDPLEFERNGIAVRFCSWREEKEIIKLIFKICLETEVRLKQEEKIMIHCHSGTGRSGVVAACLLIYLDKISSNKAINQVSEARARSLESNSSKSIVIKFSSKLKIALNYFPSEKQPLAKFLENQNLLLDLSENFMFLIPILVSKILTRVIYIKRENKMDALEVIDKFSLHSEWTEDFNRQLEDLKKELRVGKIHFIERQQNIEVLGQILVEWCEECVEQVIDIVNVNHIPIDQIILEQQEIKEKDYERANDELKVFFDIFEYRTLLFVSAFIKEISHESEIEKGKLSKFVKYIGLILSKNNRMDLIEQNKKGKKNLIIKLNKFELIIMFLGRKFNFEVFDQTFFESSQSQVEGTILVKSNTINNTKQINPRKSSNCNQLEDKNSVFNLTMYDSFSYKAKQSKDDKENLLKTLYNKLKSKFKEREQNKTSQQSPYDSDNNFTVYSNYSKMNSKISSNSPIGDFDGIMEVIDQIKGHRSSDISKNSEYIVSMQSKDMRRFSLADQNGFESDYLNR